MMGNGLKERNNDMIRSLINEYHNLGDKIKEDGLAYIANTDIPLEDRWELYKEMPDSCLNQDSYTVHFKIEEKYGKISWYDEFNKDRYSIVNMKDVIEDLEDSLNSSYPLGYIEELKEKGVAEEFLTEFKEEILQLGLGSFENDW